MGRGCCSTSASHRMPLQVRLQGVVPQLAAMNPNMKLDIINVLWLPEKMFLVVLSFRVGCWA